MTWWTVAIGVDTHKQQHVAVAFDRVGRRIDSLTVEATRAGYRRLLVWARGRGEPVFGIEGCGSYGAGLARFLAEHGRRCMNASGPTAASVAAARTTWSTPPWPRGAWSAARD